MGEKNLITYRCPVCFARENDIVIHNYNGIYRCIKCSFFGTEAELKNMYEDLRKKYTLRTTRITIEDFDKWDVIFPVS